MELVVNFFFFYKLDFMNVRTRFAPSPTGYLHVGSVRTALYNWLFARQNNGKFILRIEDTDVQRSTKESIDAILDGMKWLGLNWDEGPYFQSKRLDIYKTFAENLVKEGKAFYCFCTEEEIRQKKEEAKAKKIQYKYDGKCKNLSLKEIEDNLRAGKKFVIRLKVEQDRVIKFNDIVRGEIEFNTSTIDDFIIIKSDGFPVYNFAVVVDDALMKITHVIRGDDHISNTPKQILIYEALGFKIPYFAHLPMILGPDGSRLSKRHGATSIQQFRKEGYLPEALLNYLARLGWAYDDKQEVFSIEELIQKFDLKKVSKRAAVFDYKKLSWLNGLYIEKLDLNTKFFHIKNILINSGFLSSDEIEKNKAKILKLIEIIGPRLKVFSDFIFYTDFIFKEILTLNEKEKNFLKKNNGLLILKEILKVLQNTEWRREDLENTLEKMAEKFEKRKIFFQTVRIGITGKLVSPPLLDIMDLMGKEKCLKNIESVIKKLE